MGGIQVVRHRDHLGGHAARAGLAVGLPLRRLERREVGRLGVGHVDRRNHCHARINYNAAAHGVSA
jgi:hypothetical protein